MDEGSYHALEAYGFKGGSLKDMGFCYFPYSFLCEQEFSPSKIRNNPGRIHSMWEST